MSHLWEVDHSYYCSETNYFSNECHTRFRSWADFLSEEGDSDMDMNLVFRWDWREGAGWDLREFNGDMHYRNGRLCLYYIGQRKGLFRCVEVEVCRADEPAVREWLTPRMEHLFALWEPLRSATLERGAVK
jgi:hypothetical protein